MALYDLSEAQALALRTLFTMYGTETAAVGLRTLPGLDEAFAPSSTATLGSRLETPVDLEVGVFASGGVVQGAKASHGNVTFWVHDADELEDCNLGREADGTSMACFCNPVNDEHNTAIANAKAYDTLVVDIF